MSICLAEVTSAIDRACVSLHSVSELYYINAINYYINAIYHTYFIPLCVVLLLLFQHLCF